jgi:hypothetical protein
MRYPRRTRRGPVALRDACRCESLEARRLLTFSVSGTAGPDLIELELSGTGYLVRVNGSAAGTTTDSSILLSALGGNDTLVLPDVKPDMAITVQGGLGDDTVRVGCCRAGGWCGWGPSM